MKPSMGRIVHYREQTGSVYPAIIVAVLNDGRCDLQVFTTMGPPFPRLDVPALTGASWGWFWPPRVD